MKTQTIMHLLVRFSTCFTFDATYLITSIVKYVFDHIYFCSDKSVGALSNARVCVIAF